MKRLAAALPTLAILLSIAAIGWALWRGGVAFAHYLARLDSDLAVAIVAASATALVSILTLAISKGLETRAAIRQDLRTKKTPIYESIVQTLFRLMFADKLQVAPMTEPEMIQFFVRATEQMTIWGSDSLINAWTKFRTESTNPATALFSLESLLLAIRKDLGHRSWTLQRGSILRMFVTDIDEHLKTKK